MVPILLFDLTWHFFKWETLVRFKWAPAREINKIQGLNHCWYICNSLWPFRDGGVTLQKVKWPPMFGDKKVTAWITWYISHFLLFTTKYSEGEFSQLVFCHSGSRYVNLNLRPLFFWGIFSEGNFGKQNLGERRWLATPPSSVAICKGPW